MLSTFGYDAAVSTANGSAPAAVGASHKHQRRWWWGGAPIYARAQDVLGVGCSKPTTLSEGNRVGFGAVPEGGYRSEVLKPTSEAAPRLTGPATTKIAAVEAHSSVGAKASMAFRRLIPLAKQACSNESQSGSRARGRLRKNLSSLESTLQASAGSAGRGCPVIQSG